MSFADVQFEKNSGGNVPESGVPEMSKTARRVQEDSSAGTVPEIKVRATENLMIDVHEDKNSMGIVPEMAVEYT